MKEALTHPFAWGFYTGCVLLLIALYHHLKLKLEHGRYRSMLSDKMEIEASTISRLKKETESIRQENENLRIKIQSLNEQPDSKLSRELEIYARAEKKMMVGAPGFAGPWEQAKQASYQEVVDEENGNSAPRRFFQRFFGGTIHPAIPSHDPSKSLPAGDTVKPDSSNNSSA